MGKIITFDKDRFSNTSPNIPWLKPKTLNEYVNEMLKVQADINNILNEDWIVKVSDMELLMMLKNTIRKILVDQRAFSEKLFPCGDYVWELMHNCILWQLDLSFHTQDFLEMEPRNYKWAGDINLAKYMLNFHLKRKNPNNASDYMNRAAEMYYTAYEYWQMPIWYILAYNLKELDKFVHLPNLIKDTLQTRTLRLEK